MEIGRAELGLLEVLEYTSVSHRIVRDYDSHKGSIFYVVGVSHECRYLFNRPMGNDWSGIHCSYSILSFSLGEQRWGVLFSSRLHVLQRDRSFCWDDGTFNIYWVWTIEYDLGGPLQTKEGGGGSKLVCSL